LQADLPHPKQPWFQADLPAVSPCTAISVLRTRTIAMRLLQALRENPTRSGAHRRAISSGSALNKTVVSVRYRTKQLGRASAVRFRTNMTI